MKHNGSCHCGAVKFEFTAPSAASVTECNCSICAMSGYQHVFIPKTDLRFICGQDTLTTYTFGTHASQHMFCKICGIKPLYVPRSHPDSYSVNLRCIENGTIKASKTILFDGQNWDKNIGALKKET
ncbi:MAG: GFA family protein [Litorimonas sp.]